MSLNLWGEIPVDTKILTPKAILETQANELSSQTKGLLEGVVDMEKTNRRDYLGARLYIKVPALNNYMYEVCSAYYPLVEFYPCDLYDPEDGQTTVGDEGELLTVLGQILQSDRVKRAIRGLISQAQP